MNRDKLFQGKTLAGLLIAVTLFSSGCLESGSGSSSQNASNNVVDLGFLGLQSAIASTSGVTLTWIQATSSATVGYQVFQVLPSLALVPLSTIPDSTQTSFVDTTAAGATRSYIVRAFDASGRTDGNSVIKTAVSYAGITSATATGSTTIHLAFPATGISTLGGRIYMTRKGQTTMLSLISNTATSYDVTGLRSGTNYTFSVKAVLSYSQEDGNTKTITAYTNSLALSGYRNVQSVYSVGTSASNPTNSVTLTFTNYWNLSFTPTYYVMRTTSPSSMDLTTPNTVACSSSTTGTCFVNCAAGSSTGNPYICVDNNVAGPPTVYKYFFVVQLNDGNANYFEEIPTGLTEDNYLVTVPIPPANMALVQRDAYNYYNCLRSGFSNVGSSAIDPLNHNRCAVSGYGATPYNTGGNAPALNLPSNYFDLGYSFFIDRFEAGCNWSKSASGGFCGASASAGDCVGSGPPNNSFGINNNVYYDPSGGKCYVKASGSWVEAQSATADKLSLLYTNEKLNFAPPLVWVDQAQANNICASVSVAGYGSKRLARQREMIAGGSWTSWQTNTVLEATQAGSNPASPLFQCNSSTHNGVSLGPISSYGQIGYYLAGITGGNVQSFTIGSANTSSCASQFGVQDIVGNVEEWTSDQISCDSTTNRCVGLTSSLDQGNRDILSLVFQNGTAGAGPFVDYTFTKNAGTSSPCVEDGGQDATFNYQLGLNIRNSNLVDSTGTGSMGMYQCTIPPDKFSLSIVPASGTTIRGLRAGGRWDDQGDAGVFRANFNALTTDRDVGAGFRCVLPAQ